jgi:hypothetical protein
MPWHDLYFTDTHTIGLALIVGGAALLCSCLTFLLPTRRNKVEQSSAPQ